MGRRVAIIGAGPSGTAALRAFQSARDAGADIPEIVCFEKQEDLGGLWNYTWRTGLDEYGESVHSSMYRYLWSNGPKEALEFADYTFDEHFGKPIGSYPPRAVLFDYIKGRIEKAGVRQWCRFRTPVRAVAFDAALGKFHVTAHDLVADKQYAEDFDNIIVASGHFSTPNAPQFPGFGTFEGRILHAHDFRDAREFQGKRVLIIGSSYSAEDIGSQCWKYGCESVTVSHRTSPIGYRWPDNWKEVPLLERVDVNTAYFVDGTSAEVDAIILCTGYLHHFPYMEEGIRLRSANRLAAADLYKGCVWVDNPKLFYLGMQDQWYSFNMFDAQAWYVRDIILGRISVPDRAARAQDVVDRVVAEDRVEGKHAKIKYQGDYIKELIADTDYPSFDVEGAGEALVQWVAHKKEDIMAFRDKPFKSVMTGTVAAVHHTPWVRALDDSLECYLQTGGGSR